MRPRQTFEFRRSTDVMDLCLNKRSSLPGASVVQHHVAFGRSDLSTREAKLTHRPRSVVFDWRDRRATAAWECGGRARIARLLVEPEADAQFCARCFRESFPGPVVYFVRLRGRVYSNPKSPIGLIKIGTTTNLQVRMESADLHGGTLLAWQPGGRDVESTLHRVFADDLRWRREYFELSSRLSAYIGSLPEEWRTGALMAAAS